MCEAKELLTIAVQAAEEAGKFLAQRQDIHIDESSRRDIKLSSDKLSEAILLKALQATGIPVLSEEKGFVGEKADLCWVVDPLDGTVNYYREMDDLACVSVALCRGETPVLGVVNRFMRGEVFSGLVGEGAWLNGKEIHTRTITNAADAILATGLPKGRDFSEAALTGFVQQLQKVKKVRMLGAAALMCTFVAAGRVDIYTEDNIMFWDVAGAAAIVQAAGGIVHIVKRQNNMCLCRCYATSALQNSFEGTGNGESHGAS